MKLQTFTMLTILFFLLALTAYLDSPFSFVNNDYSYMTSEQAVAQPVDVEQPLKLPVLEQRLDNVERIDGYIVETYQEYEVFYDKDGKVIKRNPTSKMETVKYWDN
ncbi:hypothetical protein [Neobacillus sp. FSL H8-0543]|uniref:hypothetical protein n=1 Tax=Neobacillus sp. FSL H8-0543 TaxID=2954672 RepID=UPI0031584555